MNIEHPFSAFMFSMGSIWFIESITSILIGPFVGLNRKKIKLEALDFYRNLPKNPLKRIPLLILMGIAAVGFFVPAVYPILGFFGSLFFLAIM